MEQLWFCGAVLLIVGCNSFNTLPWTEINVPLFVLVPWVGPGPSVRFVVTGSHSHQFVTWAEKECGNSLHLKIKKKIWHFLYEENDEVDEKIHRQLGSQKVYISWCTLSKYYLVTRGMSFEKLCRQFNFNSFEGVKLKFDAKPFQFRNWRMRKFKHLSRKYDV